MSKRIYSFLLCLALLASVLIPVRATEVEEKTQLSISSAEEFLLFAENCRLDSYSQDLEVSLETDLDLTETDFAGIPVFCGSFHGNGHIITLSLSQDGSVVGLFRYLTGTAVVENLRLRGQIQPGGSRSGIGALAGSNSGIIRGCSFAGTVSGGDRVGGLVGINTVTGIIESCYVSGSVHGNHFVGGIAGENMGVIRDCENTALINTTPQQNNVELSDITMDTLTNSEAVNTATDIGGIAGSSSGVIRDCRNRSDVGYPHMGYNIGGIAGSHAGYITSCTNHGQIQGRKEVGGIVGHAEPAALIEFDQDALQILQGQLASMGGIVNQTAGNVQAASSQFTAYISAIQGQVQDAQDAVKSLIPNEENPQLPDLDSIQAAQNTLSSSFTGMQQSLQGLGTTAQGTLSALNGNLAALQGQINAMGATLGGASDQLGGSITDVSDLDTEADLTAKVELCRNYGPVLGDLNIGGIAGAMALENDLDSQEDLQVSGEGSLNFDGQIRLVITDCTNEGTVTAKKQSAGGIVGWQALGLVKNCCNIGTLESENADYVGGIAGLSIAYLRMNNAKCAISGVSHVGGIAGSGKIVSDCRSMVHILAATEKVGAILGSKEESPYTEEPSIENNFYLRVYRDLGGIDGVSYTGSAEALAPEGFFSLDNLPELFRNVAVTFEFDDRHVEVIQLAYAEALALEQIPILPVKDGYTGYWDALSDAPLDCVEFDLHFRAVYTGQNTVIQSQSTNEQELPILLLQGHFTPDAAVDVRVSQTVPVLEEKEILLQCLQFFASETAHTGRLLLPQEANAQSVTLLLGNEQEQWREVPFTLDGSYIVFALEEGDAYVALVEPPADISLNVIIIATVAIGLVIVFLFLKKKKTAKK